jgi:hypothetical protein
MTSVHWTFGRVDEYNSYDEAVAAIRAEHPDAEIGHAGDLSDGGDRTLVWADEAASVDDDGARAIASIRDDSAARAFWGTPDDESGRERRQVAAAKARRLKHDKTDS